MTTLTLSRPAAADAPATIAPAPRCAAGVHPPGLTIHRIVSGGTPREYMVYVPRTYTATLPVPAVLDLHGSGSHPQEQLAIDGMAAAAEVRGFVVVLPVATLPFPPGGHTWNVPARPDAPDDVHYVADVLDDAARRLCVDPTRVYATGFSGGARLASEVACALPQRIAALGAVGGLRAPAACRVPMPVIAFHGARDPVNPYAGRGPAYWTYGVEQALRGWGGHNGCSPAVRRTALGDAVQRITHEGCGADLVLYRLEDAGHVWPGSRMPFPPERFGPSSASIDATETMLRFFEQHPRRTDRTPTALSAAAG